MISVPVVIVLCCVVAISVWITSVFDSVNRFLGYSALIKNLPVGKKFYVREVTTAVSGAFLELCNSSGKTNIVRHIKDFPMGIRAGQFVIVAKTDKGEKILVPLKQ
jgi:hypothetical protein